MAPMKQLLFFLPIMFIISLSCHNDNPVGSKELKPAFYGTVVNASGVAVESVGVHFIPHLNPPLFALSESKTTPVVTISHTNPITSIAFNLPIDGIVTLILYRYGSNDLIDTLLDHVPLAAGTNEVDFDASAMTNGTYYFRIFFNDTLLDERRMLLVAFINNDTSIIAHSNPFCSTNHLGQFTLPYSVLGIGLQFINVTSPFPPDTITIVDSIDIVLFKSGYKTFIQGMKIDTAKAFVRSFTLQQ
jgi:hypothetical protein